MIQQGEMTIIETTTYRCLKIDSDGYAHLKNILHEQGRPKLILQKYCPYVVDGQIQISNSAKYFIAEWVETALANLVSNAHRNAELREDGRLTAAHFYWLETNTAPNGFWPSNEKYMKE